MFVPDIDESGHDAVGLSDDLLDPDLEVGKACEQHADPFVDTSRTIGLHEDDRVVIDDVGVDEFGQSVEGSIVDCVEESKDDRFVVLESHDAPRFDITTASWTSAPDRNHSSVR